MLAMTGEWIDHAEEDWDIAGEAMKLCRDVRATVRGSLGLPF